MKVEELEFKEITQQGLWDFRPYKSLRATVEFDNSLTASILKPIDGRPHKYCQADENSYELAIMKDNNVWYGYEDDYTEKDGECAGVWTYQSKEQINRLLGIIKELKP